MELLGGTPILYQRKINLLLATKFGGCPFGIIKPVLTDADIGAEVGELS